MKMKPTVKDMEITLAWVVGLFFAALVMCQAYRL
jgi:hypothetical protein